MDWVILEIENDGFDNLKILEILKGIKNIDGSNFGTVFKYVQFRFVK